MNEQLCDAFVRKTVCNAAGTLQIQVHLIIQNKIRNSPIAATVKLNSKAKK